MGSPPKRPTIHLLEVQFTIAQVNLTLVHGHAASYFRHLRSNINIDSCPSYG